MFALLLLSALVVAATTAEVTASRHDRSRIAAGNVPVPPNARPRVSAIRHDLDVPMSSSR